MAILDKVMYGGIDLHIDVTENYAKAISLGQLWPPLSVTYTCTRCGWSGERFPPPDVFHDGNIQEMAFHFQNCPRRDDLHKVG